jgi:hypothetical protein
MLRKFLYVTIQISGVKKFMGCNPTDVSGLNFFYLLMRLLITSYVLFYISYKAYKRARSMN